MEQIIKQLYQQAKLLGVCNLFTGREKSIEDIARLFLSPQGQEFCIKKRFPNLWSFRQIKVEVGAEKLREMGIYIDEGNVRMRNPNPRQVVLIGRTTATITCDECERTKVTLLYGAKSIVNAMKWSVVAIEADNNANVISNASENAIIL